MEESVQNPQPQQQPQQTIIVNQIEKRSNGVGTAGFVLALVGLIFCWVPVLGWILWALGLILSAVGMTKSPKGLAIAGLVLSLIGIIILIAFIGAIAGAAAMM